MSNIITYASIAIIFIVFVYFLIEEIKLYYIKSILVKLQDCNDILDSIKKSKIAHLGEKYEKSLIIETNEGKKTNIPASEFIYDSTVCKCNKLNLRMLDTGSGTLVGLGLLGTFLGLTIGVMGFDSTNTAKINESIQVLLNGMGTAFYTSLVGMACSLFFISLDKGLRHRLYKNINEITEKLDSLYYIDDATLANLNQQKIIDKLYNSLKSDIQELNGKLSYSNENGVNIPIANAVREILSENTQQTKALKSFSTDLALELNQGFDETLSRQMQQKLLPLMESVDTTTKAVIEHIDTMAKIVSAPATDLMQKVVEELKQSMQSLIDEFSKGLSGSATSELENLAHQLGSATQTMADFPTHMENISTTLQVTIEEVKRTISEISDTSANANSVAMHQMQEQIAFATGAISNAINEVKDVMSGISHSSQVQSEQMVSKLADAAENMGTFLTKTINTLSTSIAQSINNITDDVNNKQASLIALQEGTTNQTKKLLDSFNNGLERLERMNKYISGTMDGFKQAQGEITISTSNLRSISGDMKLATELFIKGQNDYTVRLIDLQTMSQKSIDQIIETLKGSGQLSEEYVQKFEVIKNGLSLIFSQLQNGLTEYSRTIKDSTNKYLAQYTSSLTQITGALASAIERQNEVTEMLTETITQNRR